MCDLENPCRENEMCAVVSGKCLPLKSLPSKDVLRITYQGHYFVGPESAINHFLARRFVNLMEVPCMAGPEGLTAEWDDNLIGALQNSGEVVSFIDSETGEILCEFSSDLFEYWRAKNTENQVNFLHWPDKHLWIKTAQKIMSSLRHIFVLVPTQHQVYHAVPVGTYKGESPSLEQLKFPFGFSEDLEKLMYEFKGKSLELKGTPRVQNLSFNSTGTRLAVMTHQKITVWNVETGKELQHVTTGSTGDWGSKFHKVLFSPVDPDILLVQHLDDYVLGAFLWFLDSDDVYSLPVKDPFDMVFNNDGDSIYFLSYTEYHSRMNLVGYNLFQNSSYQLSQTEQAFAIASFGDLIAIPIHNGIVVVYSNQTGERLHFLQPYSYQIANFTGIEFSPNGDDILVYTREDSRLIHIYSMSEYPQRTLPLPPISEELNSVIAHYNSSGDRIVAVLSWSNGNSLVCVWTLDPLEIIQLIPGTKQNMLQLVTDPSNDRRIAVAGESGVITLLEIE